MSSFFYTDGAERQFTDTATPGHVMMKAELTVRIDVNLSAYAAEYGNTVEYERDNDPVDHLVQMIMEVVPEHLRPAVLVGVSRVSPVNEYVLTEENK